MINGICALLIFQVAGESLVFLSGLPVPGPVVGLLLLFCAMQFGSLVGRSSFPSVEAASSALLANLGLFFVPAGVGIVSLLSLIGGNILAIITVLFLSVSITLVVTVWSFLAVERVTRRDPAE